MTKTDAVNLFRRNVARMCPDGEATDEALVQLRRLEQLLGLDAQPLPRVRSQVEPVRTPTWTRWNSPQATGKQCPKCREWIDKQATKCPHCRSKQPPPAWAYAVGLGTVILIIALCAGILNSSSHPTGDQRREARPLLYPEGGSRDWRDVDGIKTQDMLGFKIPTDPELRKQYFEDMEAENDRLERELIRDGLLPP